jgi:hypothetical protein
MNNRARIRNSTLGLIIALVISVWWIFMGLDSGFRFQASDSVSYWLTLGERRHTIMTIVALILIPVCALEKMWGFIAVIILGLVTIILSMAHVVYMLIVEPSGFESQLFGPVVWSIIQIPIVILGYKANQGLGKEAQ